MEPFTFPPPNPRCRVLKLQDMVAHAEAVNSCSLGRKSAAVMATGGDDLRVNCWKVGKSTPLLSLAGHSTEVDSCCFDLREELICGGSRGGSIKLWDCGTARLLRSLSGHRAAVSALDFHPFGDFFASGSADCNVKVWDIKKKGCMQTYRGHAAHVTHCLHSPDGRWIVSGDADGAVKVWDLTAGKLVHEMRTARREPVTSLAFHPAEFLLAVSSLHSIGFWDMELFSLLCQSPLSAAPIRQVCFDRDGAALLSLQADSLRVWGWEPMLCHDSVDVQWGATADVSISPNRELIVACRQRTTVSLHLLDLPLLAPYATAGDEENVTPAGAADGAEDAWKKGKQEHLMPAAMQPSPPPSSPSPPPPAAAAQTSPKPKQSILASPNAAFFRAHATVSPVAVPAVKTDASSPPPPISSGSNAGWPVRVAVAVPSSASSASIVSEHKSPTLSPPPPPSDPPSSPTPSSSSSAVSSWPQSSTPVSAVSPSSTLIPSQAAQPLNLSLSSFLSPPPASSPPPAPVDAELIRSRLMAEHALMTTILSQRRQQLQSLLSLRLALQTPPSSAALRQLVSALLAINDLAVAVDFLSSSFPAASASSSPSSPPPVPFLLTLETACLLLPLLRQLTSSRFESYVLTGLRWTRAIVAAYAPLIADSRRAGNGGVVDVVADERRQRCDDCRDGLSAVMQSVEQLKAKKGEVGGAARELCISIGQLLLH